MAIIHADVYVVFLSGGTLFLLALIRERAARNEQDLELLIRTRARDQLAFGQLYDRYAPLVYTLVLRIVGATEPAEDVVQEVFLQIWNKATMFSEARGSAYTWIMTIARRKAIDYLRSKESVHKGSNVDDPELPFADVASIANPLEAAITAEHESAMREGLASLSADQKTILELSYYDGYTQMQIAERLGMPLGTVKTRMRLGLIKLRAHLKERLKS